MCCTRLGGNAGPKKIAKNSPSGHHRTTLSGYIFATKVLDNRKNLLNSNISPRGVYRGGSGRKLRPIWLKGGKSPVPATYSLCVCKL